MFDPERLLGQMVSGALGGALGGKSAKRRSSSGMGSLLGGNAINKAQVGIGLLGVAMAAWEHYGSQAKAPAAPAAPPPGSPPPMPATAVPPPPPGPAAAAPAAAAEATRAAPILDVRRQQAVLLIRAMIAAAAADGLIDADERAGILDRARNLGDDAETLQFLQAELDAPVEVAELVAQTPRSLSREVYAAALLAIELDTPQERAWMDGLAQRLGILPEHRSELHRQLGLSS
jgi:uncharacterized membrane protein YebE (DUF533 family)